MLDQHLLTGVDQENDWELVGAMIGTKRLDKITIRAGAGTHQEQIRGRFATPVSQKCFARHHQVRTIVPTLQGSTHGGAFGVVVE